MFYRRSKKLEEYIKKDVAAGLHPKRIDTVKYASVYKRIKLELNALYRDFWKDRDTTFFLELERRTALDQELAIKYRKTLDTTFNIKRVEVFKENTKYLLDYCRRNGYPHVPEQKNLERFRFNLNASTIAYHADYQSKVRLLEYAIDAAKKGKVSWYDPLNICITFHTNAMRHNASRPIFFLTYKYNNKLNLEESYLQLYSIKKHYNEDMKRKILLRPSKFNKKGNSIIEEQLKELKEVLVNEFSFPNEDIEISYDYNKDEIDYRYVTSYAYTLSSIKKEKKVSRMVLILTEENDHSTSDVIKWLNYYNEPYLRINDNESVVLESVTHDDLAFSFREKSCSLSEIKSVWYRRGNFNINLTPFKIEDNDSLLQLYNESEIKKLTTYIHNLFKTKKNLNNFNNRSVNKLAVLKYCKENNLNNSNFIITQSKSELLKFYRKEKKVITKALEHQFTVFGEVEVYTSYTYLANELDIQKLPNYFTPTFFQSNVDKKYEIRSFYIDGTFYSMAIFSQKNNKTKVDFRHYDRSHPNMPTPYKLSEEYEKKLDRMLKEFGINCASLDTLISLEGSHHMIDINPIGQFGMTSHPCNYNLEKKIAKFLI